MPRLHRRSPGELSLKIYPFSRYDVWACGTDLVPSVAPNRSAFLALCPAALLPRSSSLPCRRSGVNPFPALAPLPLPASGTGRRGGCTVIATRAPTAGPGTRSGRGGGRARLQPSGGMCRGGAGAAGGQRQRPPPLSRPAPPDRGRGAPPGAGAGWEGGRGRPEQARRDRPRPLLPAGEALKHPGEARSPALGSPDPRAEAPR